MRDWGEIERALNVGEWTIEEKLDGERTLVVARYERNELASARWYTRTLLPRHDLAADLNEHLPGPLSTNSASSYTLDGEVVYVDTRSGKVVSLCETGVGRRGMRREYRVFDVLELDGEEVRGLPLRERRNLLNRLFARQSVARESRVSESRVSLLESWPGGAREVREHYERTVRRNGGEGLVLKRLDEPYASGERHWRKIKPWQLEGEREEYDLVAIRAVPDRHGNPVGSLECVGALEDANGRARAVECCVASGITDEVRAKLRLLLSDDGVTLRDGGIVCAIAADRTIAEVRGREETAPVSLRHPTFLRLRPDLSTTLPRP